MCLETNGHWEKRECRVRGNRGLCTLQGWGAKEESGAWYPWETCDRGHLKSAEIIVCWPCLEGNLKGERQGIPTFLLFFPKSLDSALAEPNSTTKGYGQWSVTMSRGGGLQWKIPRYQGKNMKVAAFPSPLKQGWSRPVPKGSRGKDSDVEEQECNMKTHPAARSF